MQISKTKRGHVVGDDLGPERRLGFGEFDAVSVDLRLAADPAEVPEQAAAEVDSVAGVIVVPSLEGWVRWDGYRALVCRQPRELAVVVVRAEVTGEPLGSSDEQLALSGIGAALCVRGQPSEAAAV